MKRLSVPFDKRLQQSIKNKKLSAIEKEKPKLAAIKKMFEQFFIVGAPIQFEGKPKPTILVSYPTLTQNSRQPEEVDLVTSFCFPTGLPKIPEKIKKNRTIFNEFVFLLAEGSSQIFGICVIFHAPSNAFFATEQNSEYPFCLCLLTSIPFLSTHFQFLSYLAMLLSHHIKPVAHITSHEVVPSCVQAHMLPGLVKDEQFPLLAVYEGIKGTKLIVDELDFYRSLPTSRKSYGLNGKDLSPIIPLTSKMVLAIPLQFSEDQTLAHSSFHILFNIFTVDDILTIFTAALFEEHVVLFSKNLNRLTLCVIALFALMKQFEPLSTMILPMIPMQSRFLDFLDSPFPYIIGITTSHKGGGIEVDLDTRTIINNVECPRLPKYDELKNKIESIINDSIDLIQIPPKTLNNEKGETIKNPEYLKFFQNSDSYLFPYIFTVMNDLKYLYPSFVCNEILEAFKEYSIPKSYEDNIKNCFVTDTTDIFHPITVFNRDLFFITLPEVDQAFFQRLLQTQVWDVYCNKLSSQLEYEKKLISDRIHSNEPIPKMYKSFNGSFTRIQPPRKFTLPGSIRPKEIFSDDK